MTPAESPPAFPTDCAEVVQAGPVRFSNSSPAAFILGPCQLESRAHGLEMAAAIAEAARAAGVAAVFKASFDKANRTAADAPRGVGLVAALDIFAEIRAQTGLPVLTDVHEAAQCAPVAEVCDILQIPAFLCRQTDLIQAAARTGRPVNLKKGQFMAPQDMAQAAAKVTGTGNARVLLTERGSSFGYNTLVVDFRSLPVMAATGAPVIFDATHAVQAPGGLGHASGGNRLFAPLLARAAVAVGVAGIFLETHDDPDHAPSDGPVMLPLAALPAILSDLAGFDRLRKATPEPQDPPA